MTDRPLSLISARTVNPESGDYAITADSVEWAGAEAAAHRSWREFPYFSRRYGDRGWRFTLSDSGWIVTLRALDADAAQRRILWLRELLVTRGMPSFLLERHLNFLCDELTRRLPERRNDYAVLSGGAALLRDERERLLSEDAFRREAEEFDATVRDLPDGIPRMGAVLISTVLDEYLGLGAGAGRASVITWSLDRERFSTCWITAVERMTSRVRQSVRVRP